VVAQLFAVGHEPVLSRFLLQRALSLERRVCQRVATCGGMIGHGQLLVWTRCPGPGWFVGCRVLSLSRCKGITSRCQVAEATPGGGRRVNSRPGQVDCGSSLGVGLSLSPTDPPVSYRTGCSTASTVRPTLVVVPRMAARSSSRYAVGSQPNCC